MCVNALNAGKEQTEANIPRHCTRSSPFVPLPQFNNQNKMRVLKCCKTNTHQNRAWMAVPIEEFSLQPPPGPELGRCTRETLLNITRPLVAARDALVRRLRRTAAGT